MSHKVHHLTALGAARAMQVTMAPDRADIIEKGLRDNLHPFTRTLQFHRFYDAPIMRGFPDRRISHMSDDRLAFRLGFMVEEMKEIFRDAFGIEMRVEYFTDYGTEREDCFGESLLADALQASGKRDIIELADGLGDLNVVVNGFAIEAGIDMNQVDKEIAASNFTKADDDGNPIIGDGVTGPVGKVMKGPNYMKPQLERVLVLAKSKGESE